MSLEKNGETMKKETLFGLRIKDMCFVKNAELIMLQFKQDDIAVFLQTATPELREIMSLYIGHQSLVDRTMCYDHDAVTALLQRQDHRGHKISGSGTKML